MNVRTSASRALASLLAYTVASTVLANDDGLKRAQQSAHAAGRWLDSTWGWDTRFFFRQDWCPSEQEEISLKKHFVLERNGCCIRFMEAIAPETSWLADLPEFKRHMVAKEDHSACVPISEAQRQRLEQEQLAERQRKEGESLLEERRRTADRQRKVIQQELRRVPTYELCIGVGILLREGVFPGFLELAEGASAPVHAEVKRRGLGLDLKLAKAGNIRLGSSECTMLAALGEPLRVNRSVDETGVRKQYIYRDDRLYVYTRNGRVTSWQD